MDELIKFSLTKNESIVFFEFLSRFIERDELSIEDHSEAKVLWNLHSDLEKILVEPFRKDYVEILLEARKNLRDKE